MQETIIHIGPINSHVVTTDQEFKTLISKMLRFRPKNYFHNAAYKSKRWDGWKNFFNEKNGQFLTGLLPEVKAVFKKFNKPYRIVDESVSFPWVYEAIDDQFLNQWLPKGEDPITLRDFQWDLVNIALKQRRCVIQAPTGAGKTFAMISIIKCIPPKTPTLFLTKNASLVHQNYEEMKLWGVENLGRWYGKFKEPNWIVCGTVHEKTFESLAKLLPKFKVLIVDEIHDCVSDVPVAAYKKMVSATCRFGFSATPFKWDKKKIDNVHKYSVKGHFGPVLKTNTTKTGLLTTKELQDRGDLSTSHCNFYKIETPDIQHEPYQDAVKLGIEQNFHFHDVVSKLARSRPGRTLIIVERIEQGEYLKQLMPEAHWIQGKVALEARSPTMEALSKEKKCIAIIMKQIITAGINVKIHDLINAAGGDSAHNIIQIMGRGLRKAKDKQDLEYHDFLFLINEYLQRHSEWRIEVLKKEGHDVEVKETYAFLSA